MAYRTIVVGNDGSVTAYRAQHKATRIAKRVEARLVIVCAVSSPEVVQRGAKEIVAKARDVAGRHGVDASGLVRTGGAADALVGVAAETSADLIVVG
ncbi:MAG: universal stress protein, partial [Actinomycetota bacterium]|nr:universal stress protein [Actinomycetota bacterium]